MPIDFDSRPILGDGGIETDVIYHHGIGLPDFAAFVLLDDNAGRAVLSHYWASYAALAAAAGVGLQLETPTWRASPDWAARLGYDEADLERVTIAAVALLQNIKRAFSDQIDPILIGGVVGPRYESSADAIGFTAPDAHEYHLPQIATLAGAGVDFITALTLTNPDEAVGIVQAARELGTPVVISFTSRSTAGSSTEPAWWTQSPQSTMRPLRTGTWSIALTPRTSSARSPMEATG